MRIVEYQNETPCRDDLLLVKDIELPVGDKDADNVAILRGAVFHDLPLWEPDPRSGTEDALMGTEHALEDEDSMTAGVRMGWINHALRVTDHPDLGARLRILSKHEASDLSVHHRVENAIPYTEIRSLDRMELLLIDRHNASPVKLQSFSNDSVTNL